MHEHLYDPATVEPPYRALFDQLANEFPSHEVWQLHENFGRWLSATLVERATGKALTIPIIRIKTGRTWLFHESEIQTMRANLASAVPAE